MKTAGPFTITDGDLMDLHDMYYKNVHDWLSRRIRSNMPKIITGFWMSFGLFIWLTSTIFLPLALSE